MSDEKMPQEENEKLSSTTETNQEDTELTKVDSETVSVDENPNNAETSENPTTSNEESSIENAMIEEKEAVEISSKETPLSAENRSEEHTSELQSRPHLVCRL